jgi:hypothetical protein
LRIVEDLVDKGLTLKSGFNPTHHIKFDLVLFLVYQIQFYRILNLFVKAIKPMTFKKEWVRLIGKDGMGMSPSPVEMFQNL